MPRATGSSDPTRPGGEKFSVNVEAKSEVPDRSSHTDGGPIGHIQTAQITVPYSFFIVSIS